MTVMNETTNVTPIIEAAIALIMSLITAFLIPWIRQKLSAEKLNEIHIWVKTAVTAAEQIYKETGMGKVKKDYVINFLKSKGFEVDEAALDSMIESAVYALKGGT